MTTKNTFTPIAPLRTAVLLLVFNRPDVTAQVFEAIRKAQPPRLYVAADGPRDGREGEAERCAKVREIATAVDWPCEVKTLFREKNLGCKMGVSGGINWFFENEEEGIILEDDCLAAQSFFYYCEELLERYRFDSRIMLISGCNKMQSWNSDICDYFFSNLGGIWGWASWRRAWSCYDLDMLKLNTFIERDGFINVLGEIGKIREKSIMSVLENKTDTWDYQWGFARHMNSGLACVPSVNLIENIGFGPDATHTISLDTNKLERQEILFPLRNNFFLMPDREYDRLFLKSNVFTQKIKSFFGKIL